MFTCFLIYPTNLLCIMGPSHDSQPTAVRVRGRSYQLGRCYIIRIVQSQRQLHRLQQWTETWASGKVRWTLLLQRTEGFSW